MCSKVFLVVVSVANSRIYVIVICRILETHDNTDTRDLTILLYKYQLLHSQLLPLIDISVNDGLTCRTCLRLISRLVIPVSDNTIKTLNMAIAEKKPSEPKEDSLVRIRDEKKAKENANQQQTALLAFKEVIVGEDTIFNSMINTLAGPLRKIEKDRSVGENQIVETVLHILSNLATIHTAGNVVTLAEKVKAQQLHCKLIERFEGTILNIIISFCEAINTPGFKENLNFFIDLISALFRGFDARELFKQWKVIQNAKKTDSIRSKDGAPRKAQVTVYSNNNTVKTTVAGSGLLSQQLRAEKEGRLSLLGNTAQRHSRFGGLYTVAAGATGGKVTNRGDFSTPLPAGSKGAGRREIEPAADSASTDPKLRPHQLLIRNPFSSIAENLPQAEKRRAKRNVPFAPDANDDGLNSLFNGVDVDGQQATMMSHHISEDTIRKTSGVIVQFLERFTQKGFEKLVFCVKEDLRRDENKVGFGAEELEYFKITTTCLRYHRLKVMQDREHQLQANPQANLTWVPSIRPMMVALDRISYTRVVSTINRLTVVEKKYESVMIPLECYKEMICYVHLMLQSTNTAHHELAIAALYPLFYVNAKERIDPLVQLLREWKPAIYTRKHVHLLIELVHETLKTLEAAKTCFSAMDGGLEPEIDHYIAAALRFNEVEYFERLVNHHTVKLYTILLADHRMCSATVNHYVYCFLQRMYSHKMESDKWGVVEGADQSAANNTSVTLGYLLFNIQTLDAINNVLCSSNIGQSANKSTSPLVRLLLCIVRSFAELASKNHLMYVEALFHGSRSMDHIFGLDTVYNAEATARGFEAAAAREAAADDSDSEISVSGSSESEGGSTTRRHRGDQAGAPVVTATDDGDHEKDDYGDEFDENALPVSFVSRGKKKVKRGALKRNRPGRGHTAARDDSDSDANTDGAAHRDRPSAGAAGSSAAAARRGSKRLKWTQAEDEVLRKQYEIFQGSSSCFETIALHESLRLVVVFCDQSLYAQNVLCLGWILL